MKRVDEILLSKCCAVLLKNKVVPFSFKLFQCDRCFLFVDFYFELNYVYRDLSDPLSAKKTHLRFIPRAHISIMQRFPHCYIIHHDFSGACLTQNEIQVDVCKMFVSVVQVLRRSHHVPAVVFCWL